jgi:hypothetical protein
MRPANVAVDSEDRTIYRAVNADCKLPVNRKYLAVKPGDVRANSSARIIPQCGTAQKLNLTAGGFDNQNTGRKALIAAEPVTGRIS